MSESARDEPPGRSVQKVHNKREKFVELGEKRTANAIRALRVIGKLSNKAHYEYTEQDVKKIVGALNQEIDDLKLLFAKNGKRSPIQFKL